MRIFGKSPTTNNFVVELTPDELDAASMMFAENPEEESCSKQPTESVCHKQKGKQIDQFLNGTYQPENEEETMSTADNILDAYSLHKISKDTMIKLMNKIGF